jgi:hypothetical protein
MFSLDILEDNLNHATWLTVISLDLPPSVPVGTGTIKVIPTRPDVIYPQLTGNISGVDITMEVIAGQGTPNPFKYKPFSIGNPISRTLSDLEPAPQVIVIPPDITVPGCCGSIEFKLTAPWLSPSGDPVPDSEIFVIKDAQNKIAIRKQISLLYARNSDVFTVMFVTPKRMDNKQSRFTITSKPGNTLGGVTLDSITYYNNDGLEIAGPAPNEYKIAVDGF